MSGRPDARLGAVSSGLHPIHRTGRGGSSNYRDAHVGGEAHSSKRAAGDKFEMTFGVILIHSVPHTRRPVVLVLPGYDSQNVRDRI